MEIIIRKGLIVTRYRPLTSTEETMPGLPTVNLTRRGEYQGTVLMVSRKLDFSPIIALLGLQKLFARKNNQKKNLPV